MPIILLAAYECADSCNTEDECRSYGIVNNLQNRKPRCLIKNKACKKNELTPDGTIVMYNKEEEGMLYYIEQKNKIHDIASL